MKTKFDDLPEDVRHGLCDMNADLSVAFSCIEDPEIFTDPEITLKTQLKQALEILAELLV